MLFDTQKPFLCKVAQCSICPFCPNNCVWIKTRLGFAHFHTACHQITLQVDLPLFCLLLSIRYFLVIKRCKIKLIICPCSSVCEGCIYLHMVESSCKFGGNLSQNRCCGFWNWIRFSCALFSTQLAQLTKHAALKFQHTSQPGIRGLRISTYLTQIQMLSSASMKILNILCQQIRQLKGWQWKPQTEFVSVFHSMSPFVCWQRLSLILQVVLALKKTLLWKY